MIYLHKIGTHLFPLVVTYPSQTYFYLSEKTTSFGHKNIKLQHEQQHQQKHHHNDRNRKWHAHPKT